MSDVRVPLFGRDIDLIPGVRIAQFNYYLAAIIGVYQGECAAENVIGAITGGIDEPPGVAEKDHLDSRALDLRSGVFDDPPAVRTRMEVKLKAIDKRFIVLYLNDGYGWHFHAAFRP